MLVSLILLLSVATADEVSPVTETLTLSSTKMKLNITYKYNNQYEFAINVNTPCCLVSKTSPKCTLTGKSNSGSFGYDYSNRELTVSQDLPYGEYDILVYKHKGQAFSGSNLTLYINELESDGVESPKKFIVEYNADTNMDKYIWWKVLTINRTATDINLIGYDGTLVYSEYGLPSTTSYDSSIHCSVEERNGAEFTLVLIVFSVLLFLI